MVTASKASSGYDYLLKALLVGDSGVGKSSILLRFTADEFDDQQLATIGVDFKEKYLDLGGKRVKLFIWDTAGQERLFQVKGVHREIRLNSDCSSRESFTNLEYWLQEVKRHCSHQDAVKLLVGNKVDRENRAVSRKEGEQFAMKHSMLFIETSAKTRFGIQQAFEELVMKVLENPALIQSTGTQWWFPCANCGAQPGGGRHLQSNSFAEPVQTTCLC